MHCDSFALAFISVTFKSKQKKEYYFHNASCEGDCFNDLYSESSLHCGRKYWDI